MEQSQNSPTFWGRIGNFFNRIANPSVFLRFTDWFLWWVAGFTVLFFVAGIYMGLQSPPDYQQGETAKIMYVHVPTAWLSMMCYTIIFVSSIGYLIWRHPLADVSAQAAAPIGAVFTFLALITGSLWGKPMWGTYWEWGEPRLMSVLILFFLYLGLMALRGAIEDKHQAAFSCAILGIVGYVIVPIIKFSVEWWNTLHQPASVLKFGGPAIHPSILWPLLLMAVGFTGLFFWLHMKKMRAEILRRRVLSLQMSQVEQASRIQVAE